jgi:hypothetical protein
MSQPQGALLVGSVNYPDAETTFRTAANVLGARLKRIPDGEVGKRFHWIMCQPDILGQTEGIERVGAEPIPFPAGLDARPLRIAGGVSAADLRLPPLGYAAAARESYAIFSRLREDGVISRGTRFEVALPTPLAVVNSFFPFEQRAAIDPVYTAAIEREVAEILAAIPHEDLAIQWDVAPEMGIIEGAETYGTRMRAWWTDADPLEDLAARVARMIDLVPADVEVGVHLCYGDVAEKHFVEPTDAGNLVAMANATVRAGSRPVTWLHLPVPIERDDDAYYAPLNGLALADETELYLGLIHREDGVEGARRRIAVALQYAPVFGVATECGCGRAPQEATAGLLATHAEVASAW